MHRFLKPEERKELLDLLNGKPFLNMRELGQRFHRRFGFTPPRETIKNYDSYSAERPRSPRAPIPITERRFLWPIELIARLWDYRHQGKSAMQIALKLQIDEKLLGKYPPESTPTINRSSVMSKLRALGLVGAGHDTNQVLLQRLAKYRVAVQDEKASHTATAWK